MCSKGTIRLGILCGGSTLSGLFFHAFPTIMGKSSRVGDRFPKSIFFSLVEIWDGTTAAS
jgi:hypothetical protein